MCTHSYTFPLAVSSEHTTAMIGGTLIDCVSPKWWCHAALGLLSQITQTGRSWAQVLNVEYTRHNYVAKFCQSVGTWKWGENSHWKGSESQLYVACAASEDRETASRTEEGPAERRLDVNQREILGKGKTNPNLLILRSEKVKRNICVLYARKKRGQDRKRRQTKLKLM